MLYLHERSALPDGPDISNRELRWLLLLQALCESIILLVSTSADSSVLDTILSALPSLGPIVLGSDLSVWFFVSIFILCVCQRCYLQVTCSPICMTTCSDGHSSYYYTKNICAWLCRCKPRDQVGARVRAKPWRNETSRSVSTQDIWCARSPLSIGEIASKTLAVAYLRWDVDDLSFVFEVFIAVPVGIVVLLIVVTNSTLLIIFFF